MRACSICGKEYRPTGNDQKYCADCGPAVHKAKTSEWNKTNHKTNLEYQAEYRKANREKVRIAIAKWRKENSERAKATDGKWAKENPEKATAGHAKWNKVNPEKKAVKRNKRRAAKYGNTPISEMLTSTEWLAILAEAGGHCAYCDKEAKLTLDHVIPLSKGGKHSKDNVVPACEHCNKSKGNKTLEAWNTSQRAQLEAAQ